MIPTSEDQSQWRRRARLLQSVCRLRLSKEKTVVFFPQSFQEQLSVKVFRPTTDTIEGANAAFSIGLASKPVSSIADITATRSNSHSSTSRI
jgi:hypothetical protein